MNTSDFDYELPDSLIAHHPSKERSLSKLFIAPSNNESIQQNHYRIAQFSDLINEVNENDLLIFNDTKVIPARLFGFKASGGKVEIFLERLISDTQALVQMRASKGIKEGQVIEIFASEVKDEHQNKVASIRCEHKDEGFYQIALDTSTLEGGLLAIFESYGKIPLPPYIERSPESDDLERYQTVYAKHEGAVAAPTAGLHFDDRLLTQFKDKNINMAYVTLHIGAGTFQPVRVEDIRQHEMHKERLSVSADTIKAINNTKKKGGRIIAVGTTTVRALETMMQALMSNKQSLEDHSSKDFYAESQIFIYPGYKFLIVDGLVTNFHLPRSTLIMMVCAFAGYDNVMQSYRDAVKEKMRFYSYGDAMLLWRT